jgi:tetratricopeptide (TPR) repeat protein
MKEHLDEFTLLKHSAGDLDADEVRTVTSHLEDCSDCRQTLADVRVLDSELHRVASRGGIAEEDSSEFLPGDPFRRRPRPAARGTRRAKKGASVGVDAVLASDAAITSSEAILDAVRDPKRLSPTIRDLSFDRSEQRFALLYALKESGRRIAEGPVGALEFAGTVLQRLRRESSDPPENVAARMVPWVALWVQAHVLAAQAYLWMKQVRKSRAHLVTAYRSLARSDGDETSFAFVELIESQRRFFSGEPASALALARRARATFEACGLEDLAARATVAEGMALRGLDRLDEAVQTYRRALPVFERYELWSNYVGALNSMGSSLHLLGRLDEARREYARALRRFSREEHRSWLGYLQHGLADVLFSAGRFRHAAMSLSRAAGYYADSGLRASALLAKLHEIESWARHGDLTRARHRLELFVDEFARDRTLDRTVALQIAQALSGAHPDFERLGSLRQQAEQQLQRRAGPQYS